jgi:predicted RNA binding protein YcfA (HicA-like mRNA interferase family)
LKTKEIIKLIEMDGWYFVRQKGSHRQYKHQVKSGLVTIPVHRLSNDLTKEIEKSILKQAQINLTK